MTPARAWVRLGSGRRLDLIDPQPHDWQDRDLAVGLSRTYSDDLEQLAAGMVLYDALYRWCRDATDETHNWPTNKPRQPA